MNKILLGMAAFSMLTAGAANATLIVGIDDNSATDTVTEGDFSGNYVVTDNGAGDQDANVDSIASVYVTDTAIVSINAGYLLNNPTNLHLGAILNGTEDVTFAITATDLTLGSSWVFDIGGSVTGDITATAYVDTTNTAFGIGTAIGTYTETDLTGSFSFTSSELLSASTPFSLTIVTTIIGTGSADADVNVPEPSMIALMSLGLVGLGIAGRRKVSK